jgi:hypothetical protein
MELINLVHFLDQIVGDFKQEFCQQSTCIKQEKFSLKEFTQNFNEFV